MQYGRPGNHGKRNDESKMGVRGVVPPASGKKPPSGGPVKIPDSELIAADARADPSTGATKPQSSGFIRGLMAANSDGWPIPRRRFEFSCLLVGEFGCLLLIAPVYLIFGRLHGMHHSVEFTIFKSHGAQLIRSLELALGLMGMLLIPITPKKIRGTLMLAVGLAVMAALLLLLDHQSHLLLMLVAYPSAGLLALVLLDAVTGIRPAAPQSPNLSSWQLILGSAVTAIWAIPLIVSSTCRVFPSLFSQTHLVLIRVLLMIATLAATVSGLCSLSGYFQTFTRRKNLIGRLSGTLALTVSMGIGLWGGMVGTGLIRHQDRWLRLEMLWVFLLLSGSLMLCWGGMTQRLIIRAAAERAAQGLDNAPTTLAPEQPTPPGQ